MGKCAQCGQKLSSEDKFCFKCGASVTPLKNIKYDIPIDETTEVYQEAYYENTGPTLDPVEQNEKLTNLLSTIANFSPTTAARLKDKCLNILEKDAEAKKGIQRKKDEYEERKEQLRQKMTIGSTILHPVEASNNRKEYKKISDEIKSLDSKLSESPFRKYQLGILGGVLALFFSIGVFAIGDDSGTNTESAKNTEAVQETAVTEELTIASETNSSEEKSSKEEEISYTYSELDETLYSTSTVYMRSAPDESGDKIATVDKNQEVKATGKCNETGWYRINYDDKTGYVNSIYLSNLEPKTEVEVAKAEVTSAIATPTEAVEPTITTTPIVETPVPVVAESASQEVPTAVVADTTEVVQETNNEIGTTCWLSATGSKYHSKNDCGNMNPNKAKQTTVEKAEKAGKERCNKCW